MEFFKTQSKIDFMGKRRWTAALSCLLFILSITSLIMHGLNWGLDFTGGVQLQLKYQQAADLPHIRDSLQQAGFKEAVVQSYGSSQEVLISLAPQNLPQADKNTSEANNEQAVQQHVLQILPNAELQRVESVGPEVGAELVTKGALAVLIALLGTMMYIALRFEYRFALSSAIALVHDPILILGIFSLFHIEFNLVALAAVLAVIGYSLNETIVIFDRVRENFRKVRHATPTEIVNLSINQTLSRTVMTASTTLSVVLILFLFGGEMSHNFALAFMIGIIVGMYSSIYVAGAMAITLGVSRKDLIPKQKTLLNDRP